MGRDRQGEAREGVGVPWDEAEDPERDLQEGLDAEFPGQDRVPEGEPERQEAVREHPGLDPGGVEGAEGAGPEGLRRHQREDGSGPCPLREGEVLLLEVSTKNHAAKRRSTASEHLQSKLALQLW